MPGWILVAIGSAIGGVARYGCGRLWPVMPGQWPTATMTVNLAGSCLIGVLSVLVGLRGAGAAEPLRLFWMTGVLGGFTTYSALALEAGILLDSGHIGSGVGYLTATMVGGLAAAALGRWFIERDLPAEAQT